MEELIKIIGVAFVTAVAVILLKQTKPELAFALTITGIIIIFILIADYLETTLSIFRQIANATGVENGLLKTLLKIIGVGYLTEFGAGILGDFGCNSIADKVVLAGKIAIVVLAMPILEGVLLMVSDFLQLI